MVDVPNHSFPVSFIQGPKAMSLNRGKQRGLVQCFFLRPLAGRAQTCWKAQKSAKYRNMPEHVEKCNNLATTRRQPKMKENTRKQPKIQVTGNEHEESPSDLPHG